MSTLVMRQVTDGGLPGFELGRASNDSGEITQVGSRMLGQVLGGIAFRHGVDEAQAYAWVERDGWSNGKIMIGVEP